MFLQGIRLGGCSGLLKIRAAEAKSNFPTRYDWDSFFRDAKHMNEMKAGERPDTVVLKVSNRQMGGGGGVICYWLFVNCILIGVVQCTLIFFKLIFK